MGLEVPHPALKLGVSIPKTFHLFLELLHLALQPPVLPCEAVELLSQRLRRLLRLVSLIHVVLGPLPLLVVTVLANSAVVPVLEVHREGLRVKWQPVTGALEAKNLGGIGCSEIGDECIRGGRLPSAHFLPSGYSAPFPALLWFCRDFEGLSPHLSALPTVVPPDGQSETHLAARQLASRDLRTLLPMASVDPILFWHLCTLPIRSRGTTRGVARPPLASPPRRQDRAFHFPKMEMSENKKIRAA